MLMLRMITLSTSNHIKSFLSNKNENEVNFGQIAHTTIGAFPQPVIGCEVMTSRKKLLQDLIRSMETLNTSLLDLKYSYNKCLEIGEKPFYGDEEHEAIDALFLRFSKSSEFFRTNVLSKVIKLAKQTDKKKQKNQYPPPKNEFEQIFINTAAMVETRKKVIHKINMNGEKQELLIETLEQTVILNRLIKETEALIAHKFGNSLKKN